MRDAERVPAVLPRRERKVAARAVVRARREPLLALQRTHGNGYVSRLVAGGAVPSEVEDDIERERGGGAPLTSEVRTKVEGALGADLAGVRIHTGRQADGLSRALGARAFTSGRDVFFRAGAYEPSSSAGRELLAHELVHVVQQSDEPIKRKLELGSVDDEYEREADAISQTLVQRWHESVPEPLATPGGPPAVVRRACDGCSDDAPCADCGDHGSPVQRQADTRERGPPRQPATCVPAPGLTNAGGNCVAYTANSAWLPFAYVNNATCACLMTPNDPTAMCVRKVLQDRLATVPPAVKGVAAAMKRRFERSNPPLYAAYVMQYLTPTIYLDHVIAYRSCCCPSGPAPYPAWIGVTTVPLSCVDVGLSIRLFGSCHGTPGRW